MARSNGVVGRRALLAFSVLPVLWAGHCGAVLAAEVQADDACAPADGLSFICGLHNAEDLLKVPGTRWIIASGMSGEPGEGGSGHLYQVDAQARTAVAIHPGATPAARHDKAAFPDCPGPLDTANYSAHGLALQPGDGPRHRLYVTSHGAREAVEVFDLEASDAGLAVTWVGCVPIPAGNDINSVAALADGTLLVTRISAPTEESSAAIFAGEPTGFLYRWQPGGALEPLPSTEMSGPNGIIASADGAQVYVGSWGRGEVARFVRAADGSLQHDRTVVAGFRVDNLRWTDEGTILAAGHRLAASQDCGQPLCFDDWEVAEIDAASMTVTTLLAKPPLPGFLGATAAIRDGGTLWLGTFHGERIIHLPQPGTIAR